MPKIARPVVLSESNREQLQSWVRAQFTPQQVVLRSRILLMAAEGKQDLDIASELEINRHTPALWRKRFHAEGLDGVWETRSGRGRKPSYDQEKVAALIEATLHTKPKGSTHWSCRTRRAAAAHSLMTMSATGRRRSLRPWKSWRAKSSVNAFLDIAIRSF